MNIIEKTYSLNGSLQKRSKTTKIILHHAAATTCTAEQVDSWHKDRGWTCIGYHFFVRKDGSIYRGRREDTVGAHTYGYNNDSIGICAEGNFENETMPEVQKKSLIELVAYLKNKYGISTVKKHNDFGSTACPGRNFPFADIVNGTVVEVKPSVDTNTNNKKATDPAQSFDSSLAGTYKVTANSGLNVRNGAGTNKSIMVAIPKGTKVKNYGYYTVSSGRKWLYIQFTYKNITYTGFATSQYLAK